LLIGTARTVRIDSRWMDGWMDARRREAEERPSDSVTLLY
jgi:hypothetical protein